MDAEESWESASGGTFPEWLLEKSRALGFDSPTAVQAKAIPLVLSGADSVVQAETGSGKTLAYLLPLIARVDPDRQACQAIVIVPTRELGLQVSSVAKQLTAKTGILVMSLLDGSSNKRQRAWAWAEPPQIVIANPGPLEKLLRLSGLRSEDVSLVVVDEVDACAEVGNKDLHVILSQHLSGTYSESAGGGGNGGTSVDDPLLLTASKFRPPDYRQTVFLSATIPQPRHFLSQCAQRRWCVGESDPKFLQVGSFCPPQLVHKVVLLERESLKVKALRRTIRQAKSAGELVRAIVFCKPGRPLQDLAAVLNNDPQLNNNNISTTNTRPAAYKSTSYGTPSSSASSSSSIASAAVAVCGVLDGDSSLDTRAQVMAHFRDGVHTILLASDLASRGLDVPETSHVVHFDMARNAEGYLHRSGRAGRLGRPGTVVSLVVQSEEIFMQRVLNKLDISTEYTE